VKTDDHSRKEQSREMGRETEVMVADEREGGCQHLYLQKNLKIKEQQTILRGKQSHGIPPIGGKGRFHSS